MLQWLLRRYPVPVGYLAMLGVVSVGYANVLSVHDQRFFVQWASTNLTNLAARPVAALAVSAFVTEDPLIVWAVLTTLGLVLLVCRFGNRRAALLVVTAHVVGTLVSEGIAAWRLSIGDVPSAIRHIVDVGPSYVTVSALVAVLLFAPTLWHRAAAGAGWLFLAPFLFEGLTRLDVAAVGHAVSSLVGGLIGAVYAARERRHKLAGWAAEKPVFQAT